MTLERRASSTEFRTQGRRLEGYAAVFGVETRIADFVEVIQPGAFTESLKGAQDIIGLADHDIAKVLARTRTGTLRLMEDGKGLSFSLDLPETQAGRDVLALAERGDLGGMSFGFTVNQNGETWQGNRRSLQHIDLREISVVSAWPAYEGTVVTARSRMPVRLALARRYLETL